jgi:hypothetical protein
MLLTVLLLASAALSSYVLRHHMGKVAPSEHGSASSPQHVLIATQGSAFKNRLVEALIAQLAAKPVHVRVIDIAELASIDIDQWQAIVIVHTWEIGRAPYVARTFVARQAAADRIIDVTTSGSGREKLPGIDVISSASVMTDVPALASQIIARIDARLAHD